jgi:hypothetical protein
LVGPTRRGRRVAHNESQKVGDLYSSSICTFTNRAADLHNVAVCSAVQQHYNEEVFVARAIEEVDKGSPLPDLCTPEYMRVDDNPNMPSHELHLFRGCFVMLMRNFLLSREMCNGSLFVVVEHTRHTLRVMNAMRNSPFFGQVETLFRFRFVTANKFVSFTRTQFPVRLAHAGTVHRFQGHTVPANGKLLLDFQQAPFAHSQTYVGTGRAQNGRQVTIIQSDDCEYPDHLAGVVFRELTDYHL